VVRIARDGERELAMMRWGFPPPPNLGTVPVTNVRNLKSPYWCGWLKAEWRCLVLATSFCGPSRVVSATIGPQRSTQDRRSVTDSDTAPNPFTESLNVGFAVGIEEFLAALLPGRFEFGRRDVPIRPAFLRYGAQVLAKIFQSRPAEEPVAVVDFINDKTGFEDDRVGDHGIVERIGVFGDVEIFLHDTARIREERRVGADSAAVFIRLSDIVGANGDKSAIGDLELTMESNEPFGLPAVLGAETSSAQHQNHGMLSLQFGELPAFCGVVGEFIVGEDSPWNNVRSHWNTSTGFRMKVPPDGECNERPKWVNHYRHGGCRQAPCVASCLKADVISQNVRAIRIMVVLSN